jgi:hypothetical protein
VLLVLFVVGTGLALERRVVFTAPPRCAPDYLKETQ